jgi:hypothetical protein
LRREETPLLVTGMQQKGCELPRLDVIALRTEQPQGRTIGWLLQPPGAQAMPRRDLSLAVQRGDVADQAADLTTLMSDPACGKLIPPPRCTRRAASDYCIALAIK